MKDEIILRSDLMKMRFITDKFSHLFVSSSSGVESNQTKTFFNIYMYSPRRCQIISDKFKILCVKIHLLLFSIVFRSRYTMINFSKMLLVSIGFQIIEHSRKSLKMLILISKLLKSRRLPLAPVI